MEQPATTGFAFGRPFGTRVVVRADDAAEKTPSGLLIPENIKERPQFGTVLAVGTGVTEELNEGDRVVFGKHAGVPLVIADVTYYVMQEREIFMTLDQDELDKVNELLIKQKEPEHNTFKIGTEQNYYELGDRVNLYIDTLFAGKAELKVGKFSERFQAVEGHNVITFVAIEEMMLNDILCEVAIYHKPEGTEGNEVQIKRASCALNVIKGE